MRSNNTPSLMRYATLLTVLILLATACTDQNTIDTAKEAEQKAHKANEDLNKLKEGLKNVIVSMNDSIKSLESDNLELNMRLNTVEKKLESGETAVVSAVGKGYGLARNEYGSFPISVESAEPYLDGHKLVFKIGNPLAADITTAKIALKYGSRAPEPPDAKKLKDNEKANAWKEFFEANSAWIESLLTTDANIQAPLKSASWNTFEMIVSPSKPDQLAYLEVGLEISGLSLLSKK